MNASKKRRIIIEAVLIAAAAVIVAAVLSHHVPKILEILESGDVNDIDAYLQEYGTDGRLLLILLQVIETISIVLPAMPVYICSGIMFGKISGILVSFSVNLALNVLMFLFGRKMKGWVRKHFDITKNQTVNHMMESARHMDRIVMIMCLVPVVPNGTIPYLASQTDITTVQFIRAIAVGSFPAIAFYVCCGDILLSDGWKIILPIIVVLAIAGVLFLIFRKRIIAYMKPRVKNFIEG